MASGRQAEGTGLPPRARPGIWAFLPAGAERLGAVALGLAALGGILAAGGFWRPEPEVRREANAPAAAQFLDLNQARAGELMLVEGVGPALAGRILEWRERHGPFGRLEDLLEVRGVGPRTLERIARLFRVAPATSGGVPPSPGGDAGRRGEAPGGAAGPSGAAGTEFDRERPLE